MKAMRRMRDGGLIIVFTVGIVLSPRPAEAQYTDNYQTNIISGITTNWAGDYIVGSNTFADVLLIQNSGKLYDQGGYLGYEVNSSNNSVLVTGSGSVWETDYRIYVGYAGAGNSLVISNGGMAFNRYSSYYYLILSNYVGYDSSSSNNSVLVTGSGSVWSNRADMFVGYSGARNSVVMSNGGRVYNNNIYFGNDSSSSSNSLLVTDSNSVWNCGNELYIGYNGAGNSVVVSNSGRVLYTGAIYLGGSSSSSNNSILIAGPSSIWNDSSSLGLGSPSTNVVKIGCSGAGNSLVISNGGQMFNNKNVYVGYDSSSSDNSVLVTGTSSICSNSRSLFIGYSGTGNSLQVSGGTVFATNLVIGVASAGCDNIVQLDSGSIIVTNAIANAVLEVRNGQFILNGGVLQANKLVITNPCARFIRNGGTLIVGSLVLDPNLSAVGDGIPNGWKQQYGFDPFDPNLASEDSDGDGFNNLREYLSGTNPTNSASYLHISSLVPTGADVLVNWTTVGGKSYAVQTNSVPGSGFDDVSPVIAVPGDGESETNYLDVGSATNSSARYYRIRLVP